MTNEFKRHRRLRQTPSIRSMVRETHLHPEDFIFPLFVVEGAKTNNDVASMPGVYQVAFDNLKEELDEIVGLGLTSVIVFGVPKEKDPYGKEAYNEQGIVQKSIRFIKDYAPQLTVIADTCLCQYTDHGHCGVVREGVIENDASLELLAKTAVTQAGAGADIIAPSNMMDGFVSHIREELDESGYPHVPIMSYAVKYASAFYGPFRDAAHSTPQFGDRKTYQMDPANRMEAKREVESDLAEGADFLIVKPALSYLDIMRETREVSNVPIVAYNVSGEYSMIKAAAEQGWVDEKAIVSEKLLSMKRAGADMIVTYHAKDMAKWLKE
ncbi:porphobilinogen synthase [Salimicrobium flavidum]|nr:porphobilinogen synthase [Salimicrobium flavidum]